MFDGQRLDEAEDDSAAQEGTCRLVLVATEDDIAVIESGNSQESAPTPSSTVHNPDPAYRMSKYLQLLAMPPPLRKLRASI